MIKINEGRTDWLLVTAQVQSEWDFCTHCLIEIGPNTIENWKKFDEIATELRTEHTGTFHCLTIWEYSDFVNMVDDKDVEIIPRDSHSYIDFIAEMGEDTMEDFIHNNKGEQKVDCHQIKFYGNGIIKFIAYGKHTGEEFYSDDVNINTL